MTTVVIIYHSGYGHTQVQAESVHRGVEKISGVKCQSVSISVEGEVSEKVWNSLTSADAIIFGSPTYMGSVSWQFKKFADASSKQWATQDWKNKIAAGFTNSASMNGDKLTTLQHMVTLAMQHGMIWASTGLMPSNTMNAHRNDINYLGSYLGLMAQSPSDSDIEQGPLSGDLDTAVVFGERVAEIAKRWRLSLDE